MLTDEELETLLTDLESDQVERKRSAANKSKIAQAICAFANDLPRYERPGVVFIGVNDDGSCAKLQITDQLLLSLASMRGDGNILPFPIMSVRQHRLNECSVVVVIVEPSENPPVRYNGRCWIRIGPRRGQASAEEEKRLIEKRRWGNLPFDMHGVPLAAIDDLNLQRFGEEFLPSSFSSEVLEENSRSMTDQMTALRLITNDDKPTVTAVLFLAKDVRQWLPGAYIQFVRFAGTAVIDPIKSQYEISGTLVDQLRRIDEVMVANISTAMTLPNGTHVEHPDYPLAALQQLVRNAVLHRSYEQTNAPVRVSWFSDRIEIFSPGGPFGQVTIQNFGQPNVADYRNPTIAESLKAMGFLEKFGIGIALAREALARNGNPEPEFAVNDSNVLAIVRPRK